jgi:outer membrane protein OmpA-like peptidoglycan-associated protein
MKRMMIMMVALALAWLVPCFAETEEEFLKLKAQEESQLLIPKGKFKVIPKTIIIEGLKKDCEFTFRNENVLFHYGQPKVREECRPQLVQIAEALKQAFNDPALSQIETYYVDGHTCNIGSYENNCRLSWNRSSAAIEELVALGVPRNRLASRGFSYNMPARPNDTEENRQSNRRVVVSGDCKKTAQQQAMAPCQMTQAVGSQTSRPEIPVEEVEASQTEETTGEATEEKGRSRKVLPQGFRQKQPEQSPTPQQAPKALPPGFKRTN